MLVVLLSGGVTITARGESLRSASRHYLVITVLHTRLGEVEEIWYDSVDCFKIHGWIVKPPDFDPNRFREFDYHATRSHGFLDASEPGSTMNLVP